MKNMNDWQMKSSFTIIDNTELHAALKYKYNYTFDLQQPLLLRLIAKR